MNTQFDWLEFLATLVCIAGIGLLSMQIFLAGWLVNASSNVMWFVWGVRRGYRWLAFLQLVLFSLCINGLARL